MQKFQLTRSRGAWLDFLIQKMQESIFQLTRSRGAWHRATWNYLHMVNFNSHAHVERDLWTFINWQILYVISTHTLTWSVTLVWNVSRTYTSISTHTLTWSVTRGSHTDRRPPHDFNSHAHVERDDRQNCRFHLNAISTHTLTWSVTLYLNILKIITNYFNSHAHVERDIQVFLTALTLPISTHTLTWSVTKIINAITHTPDISTHTLTWSVTIERNWNSKGRGNFNSHAHVERDCPDYVPDWQGNAFQLTRSRGAWHHILKITQKNQNFNSHAHVERDWGRWIGLQVTVGISTHTLTWSVTNHILKITQKNQNFNSHAHVERDMQID